MINLTSVIRGKGTVRGLKWKPCIALLPKKGQRVLQMFGIQFSSRQKVKVGHKTAIGLGAPLRPVAPEPVAWKNPSQAATVYLL